MSSGKKISQFGPPSPHIAQRILAIIGANQHSSLYIQILRDKMRNAKLGLKITDREIAFSVPIVFLPLVLALLTSFAIFRE